MAQWSAISYPWLMWLNDWGVKGSRLLFTFKSCLILWMTNSLVYIHQEEKMPDKYDSVSQALWLTTDNRRRRHRRDMKTKLYIQDDSQDDLEKNNVTSLNFTLIWFNEWFCDLNDIKKFAKSSIRLLSEYFIYFKLCLTLAIICCQLTLIALLFPTSLWSV